MPRNTRKKKEEKTEAEGQGPQSGGQGSSHDKNKGGVLNTSTVPPTTTTTTMDTKDGGTGKVDTSSVMPSIQSSSSARVTNSIDGSTVRPMDSSTSVPPISIDAPSRPLEQGESTLASGKCLVTVEGSGIKEAIAGKTAEFTICIASDPKLRSKLGVRMTGPARCPPVKFRKAQKGASVSWVPPRAGTYYVHITIGGQPIDKSPFEVRVFAVAEFLICKDLEATIECAGASLEGTTAEVISPSCCALPSSLRLVDPTHFGVSFVPNEAGIHCINFLFDDEPPTQCDVRIAPSQVGDASLISLGGDGLQAAAVMKWNSVMIDHSKTGLATLRLSIKGDHEVEMHEAENTSDYYRIVYRCREAGTFIISIDYGHRPVPGSPFTIECKGENEGNRAASKNAKTGAIAGKRAGDPVNIEPTTKKLHIDPAVKSDLCTTGNKQSKKDGDEGRDEGGDEGAPAEGKDALNPDDVHDQHAVPTNTAEGDKGGGAKTPLVLDEADKREKENEENKSSDIIYSDGRDCKHTQTEQQVHSNFDPLAMADVKAQEEFASIALEEAKGRLAVQQATIQDLKKQWNDSQSIANTLTEKIDATRNSIVLLREQLRDDTADCKLLNDKIQVFERARREKEGLYDSLEEDLERLEDQVKQMETANAEKKETYDSLKRDSERIDVEIESLNTANAEKLRELDAAKGRVEDGVNPKEDQKGEIELKRETILQMVPERFQVPAGAKFGLVVRTGTMMSAECDVLEQAAARLNTVVDKRKVDMGNGLASLWLTTTNRAETMSMIKKGLVVSGKSIPVTQPEPPTAVTVDLGTEFALGDFPPGFKTTEYEAAIKWQLPSESVFNESRGEAYVACKDAAEAKYTMGIAHGLAIGGAFLRCYSV